MSTFVAFVVAVLALQSAAPHTPVTGARISLVPKPQAVLNVTIENRRSSPLVEWQIPTVRLAFVLFDDLSFEGSAAARDGLLRRRETQADDHAYAIAVMRQIAALPPGDVEAFLVAKRAERARQLQWEGRRAETHLLEQLLREAKGSPERFVAGAKARRESLEVQHHRLLRHKTPAGAAK